VLLGTTPLTNRPPVAAADAATMADILFQKPNLIAVHADQMLESLTN